MGVTHKLHQGPAGPVGQVLSGQPESRNMKPVPLLLDVTVASEFV